MLLLITGASGVGKSTVRSLVAGPFARVLDTAELAEGAGGPPTAERAVRLALEAQRARRHLLLCGEIAPRELLAAPSADRLGGLAACLLDASEDALRRRLLARGDATAAMAPHVARAGWLRGHVVDPERRWSAHVIDTSELRDYEVAARVSAWVRSVIGLRARLRAAVR